jgi:hypothetical protein
MSLTRRNAFVLCLIVLFGYEGYALFVRETGLAGHEPRARELHLTREINAETPLSQTFVAHADGFYGVEIFARPSEQAVVGPLEVTVSRVQTAAEAQAAAEAAAKAAAEAQAQAQAQAAQGQSQGQALAPGQAPAPVPVPAPEQGEAWTTLAHESLDAARLDLSASGSIVVKTAPVTPSAGTRFRVDVAMPQAPRGHGVRLESGGPTYEYGAMTIGGRQEWGDLKFRTLAERSTVVRNIRLLRRPWPSVLHNDGIWILILLIANAAVATAIYYLVFAPEEEGSALTTADQPRV